MFQRLESNMLNKYPRVEVEEEGPGRNYFVCCKTRKHMVMLVPYSAVFEARLSGMPQGYTLDN